MDKMIKFNTKELLAGIGCVGKGSNKGILVSIKKGQATLSTSNAELSVQTKVQPTFDSDEEVQPFALSNSVIEYIKKLNGDEVKLEISENGEKSEISARQGKSHMKMPLEAIKMEEPKIGQVVHFVKLKASTFAEIVEKTTVCAAKDDSRPVLKGINLKGTKDSSIITLCALDSYKVYKEEISTAGPLQQEINLTINADVLSAICRDFKLSQQDKETEISLAFTEGNKQMLLVLDTTVAAFVAFNDAYVNYDQVIPSEKAFSLEINPTETIEAINRLLIISESGKNILKFTIDHQKITLTSNNSISSIEEEIELTETSYQEAKPFVVAFNGKYVRDILNNFIDEKIVRIDFITALKPVIVKCKEVEGKEDKRLAVILPVKTS